MKKILGIIVLGLLLSGNVYADRLGISEKKLDINFNCNLAEDLMLKSGFPIKAVESVKKTNNNYNFGYKEYNHPEDNLILIHLNYNNKKNQYSFPDSIATKWKSESTGVKFYYLSYLYGGGSLVEIENVYLGGEDFLLNKLTYKVDKKNIEKFDKKFDELNKLPDDGFVKSLKLLTKDFYDYATKNKGKHYFYLPYNCKAS